MIFFRDFFVVIASAVIVLAWLTVTLTEERSQKIDDLPVLATCWSGTSAMFPSKLNGPIAPGTTR